MEPSGSTATAGLNFRTSSMVISSSSPMNAGALDFACLARFFAMNGYVIVLTQCLQGEPLCPELPQVVIEMLVDEYAPVASTHMTKEGVVRPITVWIALVESFQERFEFANIRLP